MSFTRRLSPTLGSLRSAYRTTPRAAPAFTRTLISRDQYFLKPLKGEAERPTFNYKFLSEPATVEVGYHMDSLLTLDCRLPLLWRTASGRRREGSRCSPSCKAPGAASQAWLACWRQP